MAKSRTRTWVGSTAFETTPLSSWSSIGPGSRNVSSGTLSTRQDWIQEPEFSHLGRFLGYLLKASATRFELQLAVFQDDESFYVCSYRPVCVGIGTSLSAALSDWEAELQRIRELARDVHKPTGPATENAIDVLRNYYGFL